MDAPLDNFPDRRDFERGCMPDGALLRFASRALYASWGAPLPGKSNVIKKARKQDVPPDCGSILTPDEGEFPHTGVPCPVPEQGDASIEARLNQSEEELDAFTFARNAEISNGMMELFRMGIDAGRFVNAHPELKGGDDAPPVPVELREDAQPRERCMHSDAEKDEAMLAQGKALDAGIQADKERWAQMDEAQVASASSPMPKDPESRAESESASKPESPKNACDKPNVPAPDDTGEDAHATSAPTKPRGYRAFRVPEKECASAYARCFGLMKLAAQIAPRLAKMNLDQNALGKTMINQGRKKNVKQAFLENRAVAVVKNTLLHCDDLFRDLGFGGWMPFRYADQWLAFSSLMRKLLAANGLICPKGPNHWRDFIENTPEVEEDKLRLPKSLGPTKKYAAVESIEEVIQQATEAAKKDPAAKRRFDQRFAMGP